MFFVDALNGLEKLAATQPADRPVGLIIDEFQRVIELGGETIEFRSAQQSNSTHESVMFLQVQKLVCCARW